MGRPPPMIFGTRKVESLGYRTVRKIAEKFNRLSRVHQRHRQQTDGRPIAYSDREREFTFAKNYLISDSATFIRRPHKRSLMGLKAKLQFICKQMLANNALFLEVLVSKAESSRSLKVEIIGTVIS